MSLPELSEEQKENILKEWNDRPSDPPSLLELIKIAYPGDPKLDGRTKQGKAVKAFLATRQIRARASHEYKHKGVLDLTSEQKEFIDNNVQMMSAVEMARVLFKNETISNLNQETRTVNDYIKSLNLDSAPFQDTENVPQEDYKPPTNTDRAVTRVNRYVLKGIDKGKITSKGKRDMKKLIGYLLSLIHI